jgi:exportin-5
MRPVTKTSPVYLELEAIQWALEAVMSRLSTQEELAPILAPALDLLKLALDFPTEDPLLTSVLLSSISSLFVVVSVTPAALNPTLTRIFKCITFTKNNPVGSEAPMPQEVKALRRHGCSLLVKIASKYPQSLLPVFDYLRHTIIDELYVKSKALYKMEFATLVEALILVSNEYENYDHQTAFIESLSRPVVDKLKAMEAVISTPEAFMAFIGLDGTKDCSNNR